MSEARSREEGFLLVCGEGDLAAVELAGLPGIPAIAAATQAYADRIEEVGNDADPARLLAHHYLRYLGDLSGGQAIGKLVDRHYGPPADAMSMWHFESIPKPKVYKDGYRDLLDAFGNERQRDAVVDEAVNGFRLNRDMFVELDGISKEAVPA
ncbi:MAG: biliverdin-producing heme oxygenase [Galactobacter sp.]